MATRRTPRAAAEAADERPTLTKAELAAALHERIGFNKRESKELVDAFFALVAERLIAGEEVRIAGFGQFGVRDKSPRPGRNPRTGELVPIAARRVVTFHASPKLKEALQGGASQRGEIPLGNE
ncbi:Integration host factor subunit alpha [Tepidimonas alkaliphilus]|uniref:Integration host factor subunit alpha n=1 Tax=Tepidimonas alkaliphilus TaxID=2588942 RepID=A0A554W646_9BURK|nr:integration host factor subunit alpha [Tepidimonas alkaliphilus]TSE19043.1 Integration host factor subunit alpha [Tepidimonas alkaliphilus]